MDRTSLFGQALAEMPKSPRSQPNPVRMIEVLAFPAVQLLDVTGPLQVFASANDLVAEAGGTPPYLLRVVAKGGQRVTASAGVEIAAYPLPRGGTALDTLMIAAPGSPETQNIVNADVLRALGPEGIVVNVGRGTIVDEPALIAALREKSILAAGLDVTVNEPHVAPELLALDNAFVLPHLAGASTHSWKNMADMMNDNLKSWFAGQGPLHPVAETPYKGAKIK